ncbi:MAG TPA: aspartyl protease family protein [Hyphomonas sp.]|nr:retropepsin-like domain-containing protein [Hyphomonas sp.]MCA8903434.1 retropepsin-like domain-containing protein [Hyphomonas sp.]MCB9962212.1 retropepsin-like domain-containing protein [Hyphomonas sp.]MCB9969890.1 retropepsin-like domain-containing protein [Hyphomonas sp.]HPE46870.1 aspartyl protease family protein [Hyphomonas sp.]
MKGTWKRRAAVIASKTRKAGAALIGAALLGGLPALASERQIIPFELDDNSHMIIEMEVNGSARVEGVIDTAATFPMIDGETARTAGLPDVGENPRLVNVLGVTGPQIYPVVRLDSLVAGNVALTDVPVALNVRLDVPGATNVLPANSLDGDIIDFDFKNQRLMVYDGRPERNSRLSTSALRISEESGLLFVDIRINGKKGRALVDTGSSVTYINSRFAIDSGTTANVDKTQKLFGATGGDQSLRIATAKAMAIGDFRIATVDILVTDPPLFDYLGVAEEPAMVLGLDLLSSFRVQIDRRRNRLILSMPTEKNVRTINMNARDTHIPAY